MADGEGPLMGLPHPDPELWETCQSLITESRRVRAELDALWIAHLRARERVNDHCVSLLSEARARLDAREIVGDDRDHHANDQ
jgi:hypothetical protein